jgi:phi13 family phage major tail protein
MDPEGDTSPFYADGIVYFTTVANNGYKGDLEMALIPDDFRVDVLGDIEDGKGVLIENTNASPVHFALLFEFDGDKKKGRHIFWHCVLTKRPDITGTTKDNNLTVDTDTINVKAVKRKDCGKIKAKVYEDWSVYNTMFTSVPAPADIVDPDAESVTISGDDTVEVSDTITLTATTKPSGTAVTWSSSDTSVATVTSGGVVTGVAEGTAVITAAFSDDAAVYGSKVITVTDEE